MFSVNRSRVSIVVVFSLLLTACGGGGGGGGAPAPLTSVALPKTGQTLCYNAAGVVIDCLTTGQDGELLKGVAWPSPRFVVGTGATAACVTDNLTGLMWPSDADLPAGAQTWQVALNFANDLNLCGSTDWRLPNRKELRSLINHSLANNAATLNTLGFSNVQENYYWSSSSYAGDTTQAWIVLMSEGSVLAGAAGDKTNGYFVWPVRAGQ
jgi:Protein of unknown function (DUF1566)